MDVTVEYLVSFGLTGEFGRFRAAGPLALPPGRPCGGAQHRGVEIAEVLREAAPGHAHYLPDTSSVNCSAVPPLKTSAAEIELRPEPAAFERGRQLAAELDLPLELLDVEVLLDGLHAVLHHLRDGPRSASFCQHAGARIRSAHHIGRSDAPQESADHEDEEHHGCGRPNCGQETGGGCGTCGSGGCGTCGQADPHFAQLREQMENHRTALL